MHQPNRDMIVRTIHVILIPTKHKPARTNPCLGSAYQFFGPTWRSPDHFVGVVRFLRVWVGPHSARGLKPCSSAHEGMPSGFEGFSFRPKKRGTDQTQGVKREISRVTTTRPVIRLAAAQSHRGAPKVFSRNSKNIIASIHA